MSGVNLMLGDCLDVLRGMADNSVDSIVTDPPYGLSFMGKKWDYDVPSTEIWAECLRVLKPGGHLLAFAGTRTQHRMAVRIEDAGFEIRDLIFWCYASGFPKSHNLDNHRGAITCGCAVPYTHAKNLHDTGATGGEAKGMGSQGCASSKRGMRPVRHSDVSSPEPSGEKRGQVLQSGLQEQGASAAGRAQLPAAKDGRGQSGMERRGDAPQAARELCAGEVCSSPGVGRCDDPQGRLRYGASSGDGSVVRLSADADGVRASCGPCATEQRERQSGALAGQSEPQALGAWPVCGGCGLPVVPQGLGTALKPALEPITVARKPLIGTVAANVLEHGTGALNIDGCRVGYEVRFNAPAGNKAGGNSLNMSAVGMPEDAGGRTVAGRWPANLIHDGSDEVRATFPQAKGQQGDLTGHTKPRGNGIYGDMAPAHDARARIESDTSAARFFYCAKASKKDREGGLDGAPDRVLAMSNQAKAELARGNMHEGESGMNTAKVRKNHHPTVKPTELMAYLCRLVTPPGGVVLDPFMGSGSTGKAARLEGFGFIGIERDAAYFAIAQRRIDAATAQAGLFAEAAHV